MIISRFAVGFEAFVAHVTYGTWWFSNPRITSEWHLPHGIIKFWIDIRSNELLELTLTMLAQRLLAATYGTDSIIEPSLDAYYLARWYWRNTNVLHIMLWNFVTVGKQGEQDFHARQHFSFVRNGSGWIQPAVGVLQLQASTCFHFVLLFYRQAFLPPLSLGTSTSIQSNRDHKVCPRNNLLSTRKGHAAGNFVRRNFNRSRPNWSHFFFIWKG